MSDAFAVDLTDKCKTREQWLAAVKYGRDTLLRDPKLMMTIIVRRAEREYEIESPSPPWSVANYAAELCDLLELEFCMK